MQVKPWYASKIIWFNIATLMVAIGTEFLNAVEFVDDPSTSMIIRMLLVTFVSIGNVILRMVTNKGIA